MSEGSDNTRQLVTAEANRVAALQAKDIADQLGDHRLRRATGLALAELRRKAPTNLIAHAAAVHRTDAGVPMVAQRHHREWARILQDSTAYPFVYIVAPPGYAKSSWGSWVYPTWRLGSSHGKVRLGLIGNTYTLASGFSGAVWDTIQSPEFQAIYPDVRLDFKRGAARDQFYVTGAPAGPNPSVLASGIGGPIVGKRFDEIVVDDPLTWKDARSETVMRGIRHWVKTTLVKRLPPAGQPPEGFGRIVVIGTRWSQNDLVPLFQDLGFKIVTMPALGYWDRSVVCGDCYEPRPDARAGHDAPPCPACGGVQQPILQYGTEPLWPAVESRENLEAQRRDDELIFELVKQGNPKVLAGDTFSGDYFQRAPMPDLASFDMVVQGVDTASGKNRLAGDYFAHVTMGVKGADEWVLHVYRDRIAAPQQQAKIVELYEMFKDAGRTPDLINVEDANEGTAVVQHLEQTTRLPLHLETPEGDKEFRAIPLSNAYRARRVIHADTDVHGRPAKWLMGFEAELEAFPDPTVHDDQVDAAVHAYAKLIGSVPRVRVLG
jgi:predicted phage terminase large subunit-like protein